MSWAWKQRNVGSEKNLKIAVESYCGFSVERRPLLGCGIEIKIKQIEINSKYAIYYLSISIFQIHYRMKGYVWPLPLKYRLLLAIEGEDKETQMIPRFLNMDIGKIVVTSSEMVKFRKVSGLEEIIKKFIY